MKRTAMLKGESLLSKKVSLMRECWVPPPPPPLRFFFFFLFFILSTGISADLRPENKVKSENNEYFSSNKLRC